MSDRAKRGPAWNIDTVRGALPLGTVVVDVEGIGLGTFDEDGRSIWIVPHGRGTVVGHIRGYPRHRFPDHDGGENCVCGGDSGWVEQSEATAVVAWPTRYEKSGEPAPPMRRCIRLSEEGTVWSRAGQEVTR